MTRRAGVPLRHPGPVAEERIVVVPTRVSVQRVEIPPGRRLSEYLHDVVSTAGCAGANVELAHGSFGALRYVHPAVGEDRPAFYSEAIEPPGPCFVQGGAATVGTRDGEGFTHIHATWIDGLGRVRGGHLLPECTVGDIPIEVTVRLLHDVAWVSSTCPETMMPAFSPRARRGCERPHAVSARIRPGVDLCDAVVEVAGRAGFPTARVRAGLGSVVGARLRTGEGRVTEADWPATEFTSLAGTVSDRDVSLAAVAVDRNGDVHSGVVIPGQNPVAVTFELYLEEGAHDG